MTPATASHSRADARARFARYCRHRDRGTRPRCAPGDSQRHDVGLDHRAMGHLLLVARLRRAAAGSGPHIHVSRRTRPGRGQCGPTGSRGCRFTSPSCPPAASSIADVNVASNRGLTMPLRRGALHLALGPHSLVPFPFATGANSRAPVGRGRSGAGIATESGDPCAPSDAKDHAEEDQRSRVTAHRCPHRDAVLDRGRHAGSARRHHHGCACRPVEWVNGETLNGRGVDER
jgi:hypothetical protein